MIPWSQARKLKPRKNNPTDHKRTQKRSKKPKRTLRQASVPSKKSTNCAPRGCTVYYNTTDPNIYSPTTDLIIAACTIV